VPISCVGGERASVRYFPSPATGGPPPPFIGQGEAVYNRVAQFQLHVAVWRTAPRSRRPS
jgi:hypothetical protein